MKNEKIGAEEIYLAPETKEEEKTSLKESFSDRIYTVPTVKNENKKSINSVRTGEILDLRQANRKVYRMSDGTEQAVFFPEAVHVLNKDDNTFEDVDISITPTKDGRHFVGGKNYFKAYFSCEEDNDELFSIKSGMHRIAVSGKKNKRQKNKGIKPKIHKKCINDFDSADCLVFENVEHGVDYEYSIAIGGVKENIIIKEKSAVYRFPFILNLENVTAEFDEQNRIVCFVSNETGEEVFAIPAPFMTDSDGKLSNNVYYEVKDVSNGQMQLTINADAQWVNSEERVLPVTIDPQIRISRNSTLSSFCWSNGRISTSSSCPIGILSDECGNNAENRMYFKLKKPNLQKNPRIKKAELKLTVQSGCNHIDRPMKVGIYSADCNINIGVCTPSFEDRILDYAVITDSIKYGDKMIFDITEIFDNLYDNETESVGLMLKLMESVTGVNANFFGDTSPMAPQLIVTYESSYGISTSYRTHSHEIGCFGQGSIDLACGNLMFTSEDIAWGGNRMPVTIKHLYNSALSDYQYTSNANIKLNTSYFNKMKIGNGFKLNLMQSMNYSNFYHNGNHYNGYVYIGENGEETYFKFSEKESNCDNAAECVSYYEDVNGTEMLYDSEKRTLKQGNDTYYFDNSGRLIKIEDEHKNRIIITYTVGRITSVTDGAGREFGFNYSGDYLTSITAPNHTSQNPIAILYTYDGDQLSTVTYPDGNKAQITYLDGKPSSITLVSGDESVYKVEYTFQNDRLSSVTEFGAKNGVFELGAKSEYNYSAAANRTVVKTTVPKDTDENEIQDTVINTVYVFDQEGSVVGEYAYNEENRNMQVSSGSGINPYSAGMSAVSNVDNLLLNHSFNTLDYWDSEDNNSNSLYVQNYKYEPYAKFGGQVLRLQSCDYNAVLNGVRQDTVVLPKGEYTLSAYIRVISNFSGNSGKGAYIRVTDTNGKVLAESEHIYKYSTEFTRIIAPFRLETEQSVQVHLALDGLGAVYFDGVQLENSPYANNYNLLTNSNFERGMVGWNCDDYTGICEYDSFNMNYSLCVNGNLDEKRGAKQIVAVKKQKGTRENFTLSGWAKANSLSFNTKDNFETPEFNISAVIKYTDGTEETYSANFCSSTEDWQPATVSFAKQEFKNIESLEVSCNYNYNIGTALFDDIRLFRNSLETGLSEKDFATDTDDEPTGYIEDQTPNFEEAVDEFGNTLTETAYADGEFGTIYRSFGFTPYCNCTENAGNDLISETDSRGYTTYYTVDEDTSRNETVIDRCGNKTCYEYDETGKTTAVINKDSQDNTLSTVSYAYDSFNNLTEITRGDNMKYSLIYNAFHNLESIGIKFEDEQTGEDKINKLINYTYKKGNGRLKEIHYANGSRMTATYNGYGQLIAEKWFANMLDTDITAHYKYVYDNSGNIVRSIDIKSQKEYNYTYENGTIIRSTECDIGIDNMDNVISKTMVSSVDYIYNTDGFLTKKTVTMGSNVIEYFTEYPENANPVLKIKINGKTIESHSKTDSFGRKVFDELQLGSGFLSRQFSYHAGNVTEEHKENAKLKSSPTTNLVSQITFSGGRTLGYTYDPEERITGVVDTYTVDDTPVSSLTTYTYDALGQLLTETKNGTAVNTMEYDNYGNILKKNGAEYKYDSVWKDRLISYGEQYITYESYGNPIEYLGHTLTWEKDRQLRFFDNIQYTYNANGIRTSKVVDEIRHDFVLDGGKILKETWDCGTIIPLYDNEDSVCGIIYNGIYYYFQKNLQGDVISITDHNGETVASYAYDAWGKCTILQDATECNIATVNPYRYRGYYFDQETGMYYLQSRYYDPETGRFINGDDVRYIQLTHDTKTKNLFAYCCNDPINNIDISGNLVAQLIARILLGIIIGLFVQLLSDLISYWFSVIFNNSAAFSPNVGDYFSSALSWALTCVSPNGNFLKWVLALLPVALKHIPRLLQGNFNVSDLLIDLAFTLLGILFEYIINKSMQKKLATVIKNAGNKNGVWNTIRIAKKRINIKGEIIGIKVNLSLNISNALISIIISFINSKYGRTSNASYEPSFKPSVCY